MTRDMFDKVLERAEVTEEDGEHVLPEGRSLTLYVGHQGTNLTVARVAGVTFEDDALIARDQRGEIYVVGLGDVYAVSVAGAVEQKSSRKAGFRAL